MDTLGRIPLEESQSAFLYLDDTIDRKESNKLSYNMGTGGWPEGIEHWSSKAELFRLLRRKQRRQEPFALFYIEDCPKCEGGECVENIL